MNIVFVALIQKHVKYALQFYYCNNQYDEHSVRQKFSMTLITKWDIPSMYIIFSYVKL